MTKIIMMTQVEAVFTTICTFFSKEMFTEPVTPTADEKKQLVDLLIASYENGEWPIKNKQEKLRNYVVGLLNNHLRKDKRLNGGTKYTPKAEGSKAGATNPQVKALRKLHKTLDDKPEAAARVAAEIETRVAAIKAKKASKDIDIDALPEEFRDLVPQVEEEAKEA